MKAWLCMNPVGVTTLGMPVELPAECLTLLAVFRTKSAARAHCGKDAVLVAVEWPIKNRKKSG